MTDLEKVIRELEKEVAEGSVPCKSKGYMFPFKLIENALSLLKAQEPVEPVEMIDDFYPIGDPLRTIGWKCGKCGERIAGHDNYCSNCGRMVKWE